MKGRKIRAFSCDWGPRVKCDSHRGGGCHTISTKGVTTPYFRISLILLWLSLVTRPPLRRRSRIGEDDSDPPENRGVMWPR